MKETAAFRRRAGVLVSHALRGLAVRTPVDQTAIPKEQSRVCCCVCGASIPEGRAGRRCQPCRSQFKR